MSIDVSAGPTTVCRVTDLVIGRGAAALIGGEQIAVFRIGPADVVAVGQRDPVSGAAVMSRGIVGTRGDSVTVASPMYKQVFDLRTGRCLETMGAPECGDLVVWPLMITVDGWVQVVRA